LYLKLEQKSPIPFDSTVNVKYYLKSSTDVLLYLSDILGNEIQTLINNKHLPGEYEIGFSGHYLPTGVYLCTLVTDYSVETKRLILINDRLNVIPINSINSSRFKNAIE
jgi:hypothetical protein